MNAFFCRVCDVTEPLMRRADLLSQLLSVGRAHDQAEDMESRPADHR
ncbi:hypothetical protein G3I77_12020 [Streptomyces sp. D2-8]|nr:hypothetical protein [Streptomyces sp. D2-8]MCK8433738.1 hypothetical protein [Streptomyces sp. D2-8]